MAKEKHGYTCEYKFYIAILYSDNSLKWVTSVDNATKTARWADGEPALAMTKDDALYLQMGLICNMTTAMIVEMPEFAEEMLKNPPVQDSESGPGPKIE